MKRNYLLFISLLFPFTFAVAQPPKKIISKPKTPIQQTPKKDLSYLVPKLKLQPGSILYAPKKFYFANVVDSTRTDSLGFALLPGDHKKQKIETEGAKQAVILNYLNSITKTDRNTYPVILVLKKIEITEKSIGQGSISSSINLRFGVYCKTGEDTIFLDDIAGGGNGEIYIGFVRKYDSLLKNNLQDLPDKIDWLVDKASKIHPAFLRTVHLSVTIKDEPINEESDTIVINDRYFLNWEDFRGKPISEKGVYAATLIDFDVEQQIKPGQLECQVTIAPVFIRKTSWVGAKVRTPQFIQHEHYETLLVYLYALKLKKEIEKANYDVKTYSATLTSIYRVINDALITELQKYTYETENGFNKKQQTAWENKIDDQIQELKK